jgi:tRNA (guanine-N7-)-methyltransferase
MKKVGKRLTSTRFMEEYQQFLRSDGKIHLKTDSLFLYSYTCEMIKANDLPVIVETDDLYHCGWADKVLTIHTYYEKQWIQRGLNIKYIQFVLQNRSGWIEPEVEIAPDPYRSYGRNARTMTKNAQTD